MSDRIFSKQSFLADTSNDNADNAPPTIGGGTLIDTADGRLPIDWLVAGDRVMTRDHGFQPILWIGQTLAPMANNAPMMIEANSLGFGRPEQTLSISANQQILLRGPEIELNFAQYEVFATTSQIWHWRGVAADSAQGEVPHYCLLFAMQELICANGIWLGTMQTAAVSPQNLTQRSCDRLNDISSDIDPDMCAARMCLRDHEALILHPPERRRHRRAA